MSLAGGGSKRLIKQLNQKIAANEFYDAHQLVRAVFERFAKDADLTGAIEFAEQYAEIFAEHQQFELCVNLGTRVLNLMKQMKVQPQPENVMRLSSLFVMCPPNSTESKYEFMDSIILWLTKDESCRASAEGAALIKELRSQIADAYYAEKKFGACQNHLVFCDDVGPLVDLIQAWQSMGYPSERYFYALRLVLILLHQGRIELAGEFLTKYAAADKIDMDSAACPPPFQLAYLCWAASQYRCHQLYEMLGRKYVLILRMDPCIGRLYQLLEASVFKVKQQETSLMGMLSQMMSSMPALPAK